MQYPTFLIGRVPFISDLYQSLPLSRKRQSCQHRWHLLHSRVCSASKGPRAFPTVLSSSCFVPCLKKFAFCDLHNVFFIFRLCSSHLCHGKTWRLTSVKKTLRIVGVKNCISTSLVSFLWNSQVEDGMGRSLPTGPGRAWDRVGP